MLILAPIDKILIWPTYILSATILTWALIKTPWAALLKVNIRQHLALSGMIGLGFFWGGINVNVNDLLIIHPLLVTSCVFIFGIEIALIVCLGSIAIAHIVIAPPWQNIGLHYLIGVVVPAISTLVILKAIRKAKIKNLFIYLLGGGFLGSMFSVLLLCLCNLATFWVSGSTLLWPLLDNSYLFLLLMFPEGFCNGAIISTIAVLKPELVKTYDDHFYLDD